VVGVKVKSSLTGAGVIGRDKGRVIKSSESKRKQANKRPPKKKKRYGTQDNTQEKRTPQETIAATTHTPNVSPANLPIPIPEAAPTAPVAVVPFGNVPLITKVSVPLTFAILDVLLLGLASPMTCLIYAASVFSSHPHTEYSWHRQSTGIVSFILLVTL